MVFDPQYLVIILFIASAGSSNNVTNCGVRFEDNGVCACCTGSEYHAVTCHDNHTVEIQPCYCMYYDRSMNMTIVGDCYFSCYQYDGAYLVITNTIEFNEHFCEHYRKNTLHRMGRFCGHCSNNYGLAAYSYQPFKCIPCEDYGYKNWLKYFAAALLPSTVFYILAVLLSFSVTSSSLNGIVLVIQCITSPAQINLIASSHFATGYFIILKVVLSIICLTNLDFFRMIYPPFCLHPKMNILHVMSLDYIAAVYPFILIFITYVLITVYDKQCRLLLYIWKPCKICFHRYRKTWNVRTSLIEIFATFIFLSSVKILGVSFQILSFTVTHDVEGKVIGKYYFSYDGTIEYLPFAALALTVSFTFVLLPLLLLTFYPCGCFQRCLNNCGGRCQPLHAFMDAFQGCYRTHPGDLRSFSAFYLLLRILLLAQVLIFRSSLMFYTSGVLSFVGAAMVALFQPYKVKAHNTIDTVLIILMGVYFISYHSAYSSRALNYPLQWITATVCEGISISLLILYLIFLLLWKLTHVKLLSFIRKTKAAWNSRKRKDRKNYVDVLDRDHDNTSDVRYPLLLDRSTPTCGYI